MCANAVRGMYLSVHRSRCLSEIVKSPRPLQRLVYAVQVDGVDGNRHTNDDAVDVGESKSRRAATAPAGAAASMAALCVDLFGPYTLKGKDGSSIDFMALTMIDPASSWLEVVELPTITRVTTKKGQR